MKNLLLNILILLSLIFVESLPTTTPRTKIFEDFQKYIVQCPELSKSALFDPSLEYIQECTDFPRVNLTDDNTDSFLCVGILEAEYKLCHVLKNKAFELPKDKEHLNTQILKYSNTESKLVCEYLASINNTAEKITNSYMKQLNPFLKNITLCTKVCSGIMTPTKSFCALTQYIYKVVDEIIHLEDDNKSKMTSIKIKEEINPVSNNEKQDLKIVDNKPSSEDKVSSTTKIERVDYLSSIPNQPTSPINQNEGAVKLAQLTKEVKSISTQSQPAIPSDNKGISEATNPENTKVSNNTDKNKSNEVKSQTVQQKIDGDSIKIQNNEQQIDAYDSNKNSVSNLLPSTKNEEPNQLPSTKNDVPNQLSSTKNDEPNQLPSTKNEEPNKILPEPKDDIKKVEETTKAEAQTDKDLYNLENIPKIVTDGKDDYPFDANFESKYNNDPNTDDKEEYNGGVSKPQTENSAKFFKKNGKIYPPPQYDEVDDSNFFTYFMFISALFIGGYIAYHNKQKIMALVLEGRRDRNSRRRPNTASYRKLNSNLEEAVTSKSGGSATNVIY